jgi:GT2 family glycosyltransferase
VNITMHHPSFRFLSAGLFSELNAISTDEVIHHLRNFLGNFLLDGVIASAYLNRFGQVPSTEWNDQINAWLRYLSRKLVLLQPFNEQARQINVKLTGFADEHLKYLYRCRLPQNIREKILSPRVNDQQRRRRIFLDLLQNYTYSIELIDQLLLLDLEQDIPMGSGWIDKCRVPPPLQRSLEGLVARYCLLQGDCERARMTIEKGSLDEHDEISLNHAAEIYARTGDTDRAIALYRASLALDPLQVPVSFRLAELEHPFTPDPGMLEKRIVICLYSYNKNELLQQTLRSLATTERGNAQIIVLLNNCTDGSQVMVDAINREMYDGLVEVIDLPVNIGAPAARNWLLATEKARNADYVAFLDDDVEIPRDWLIKMLTVLRNNPRAGVVGVKILAPGKPRHLQYLYRNIAVARKDLLRISLDTPNFNYDSGVYDFVRPTANVMGCCHVFTRAALDEVPWFDIRFSPTQMDDIAHDFDLCLKGFKIMYCGLVECVHHQMSGMGRNTSADLIRLGNVLGNDVKFFYRFAQDLDGLGKLSNLSLVPEQPISQQDVL